MEPVWAVGLMTGTVLDGMIDVAMIKTDGEDVQAFGPWRLAPSPPDMRDLLARSLEEAARWQFEGPEPELFGQAEEALTRAQSAAVLAFLADAGIDPAAVAVVGFHGQTVLHRAPKDGRRGDTRQLGDGALMARLTGIDVVHDFRSADVRAGGQGAPLSAIYHAALLRRLQPSGGTVALNLGGVANLTWCGPHGRLVAFDTGPANAPLNDWVERATGEAMDWDGALARRGQVDEEHLAHLLGHSYFDQPFPKSLDRNSFGAGMVDGFGLEDGAATLTAFTAAAIGRGLDLLPERPTRVVVCGGGRKNPALMEAIASRARVDVTLSEDAGWRGDAIEAECFAFLAVRAMRALPLSFPTTTGVSAPMTGGQISRKGRTA